jgi:hypothetical protein
MTQDEVERLERNMDLASGNIRKSLGGKTGESAEKLYGQAYAALVRAGLRLPLRKKYR